MVIIINFYTLQPVSLKDSLRNVRNIGSDDRTIYPVFRQTSIAEFATCKFNLSHLLSHPLLSEVPTGHEKKQEFFSKNKFKLH